MPHTLKVSLEICSFSDIASFSCQLIKYVLRTGIVSSCFVLKEHLMSYHENKAILFSSQFLKISESRATNTRISSKNENKSQRGYTRSSLLAFYFPLVVVLNSLTISVFQILWNECWRTRL